MEYLLSTQDLLIRPIELADAAFILELVNTPTWLEYIGDRNVNSIPDAENYLLNGPLKSYEENGFGVYLLVLKETKQAIGISCLIKRTGLAHVDIGFALLPTFTKKGYAFEASKKVMEYGLKTLKLPTIIAITTESNANSIKLLLKLGLTFEKKITLANDSEELLQYSL